MAVRYRSAYRRYLFFRRLRNLLTLLCGIGGLFACYVMYQNLQQSGLPLGRKEIVMLLGVMALSIAAPWLILTTFARKPSEL